MIYIYHNINITACMGTSLSKRTENRYMCMYCTYGCTRTCTCKLHVYTYVHVKDDQPPVLIRKKERRREEERERGGLGLPL